jgi:hypothetical protein
MSNYNKNVRPVRNNSDIVNVKLGLKLIQIADVVCIYYIFNRLVFLVYMFISYN